MVGESSAFVRQFLRAPASTGAVWPSSRWLAAAMVAPVPRRGESVVVELGPGTGAFTRAIESRLDGRGRQLAVEVNPTLAAYAARRFPDIDVVVGDAAHLAEILRERGLNRADVVVSGLPWAVFPADTQRGILRAIASVLGEGGAFTTFAYVHARALPAALRFRRLLETRFDEVVTGRTVWRNFPPALVYHCRHPKGNP
ncbi:MAG TPA: methyltransferase domain-containing protein [Stackebrandtia sp.]|uniref:class I SAM-dependent methyltransferase n=1 Tax=Stackebrandtia sp. TaxID=2023065 RepID=UPI002D6B1C0D|nr:methyltransferase domain-containing protein [Stackebrandtia sp.]HZE41220.1 methyltransferase domain-containing protein [Stackebrandtia sp.]